MTICYSILVTGLYIHIPFCTQKCHYCNFVITTAHAPSDHAAFLNAFEKEILHTRSDFENIVFDTLYLGGGTPSVMNREETAILFDLIRKNFEFKNAAEITCEINPGDIDFDKAENYRVLGVNRVSLGAQSFQDTTLKRLNRKHVAKDILTSFNVLRKVGFHNISLDLILSLPGETLEDVTNSLDQLLKLAPEHVSLYELTIKEKTVFGNLFKNGQLDLPDEDLQIKMLSCARETLKKAGLRHYELLNYSKPGFESRHNQIYWANQETLGLGPGAYSYIGGRRFMYSAGVAEYFEKTRKGDWTAFEEEKLTPEKKEVESFLLALRLVKGAECRQFRSLMEKLKETIEKLEAMELLSRESGRLHLTGRGQFFAETVFSELAGA